MSPRVQIEYFPISLRDDKREVTEELRASVTGTKVEKVRNRWKLDGGGQRAVVESRRPRCVRVRVCEWLSERRM